SAKTPLIGIAAAIFLALGAPAQSQDRARESQARAQDPAPDAGACPGSAPEPGQSAPWSVAFCNRTGHDVVLAFHDNDSPAKGWGHRGDVYQRMLRKGESKTFPLCYANEPAGKKLAPGVPTLRIPGGKGVVTTWSVVGDCGEHSRPLNLDARTFYDRGEYRTGIVLLQHPAGAAHCVADVGSSAAVAGAGAPLSSVATPGAPPAPTPGPPPSPVAPHSPIAAPPGPSAAAAAAVNNRGSGTPTLSAAVDAKDVVSRTVRVFAKDGAGYKCNFNLAVTFTDGVLWNDHGSVDITAGD